jgi:hypothetical protein
LRLIQRTVAWCAARIEFDRHWIGKWRTACRHQPQNIKCGEVAASWAASIGLGAHLRFIETSCESLVNTSIFLFTATRPILA